VLQFPIPPPPPPPPRQLLTGFFVITDRFPSPGTILPFRAICIDERPNLEPFEPYARLIVDSNREDLPPIDLTFREYNENFLPALNPAVNSGRPHKLMLEDLEVDGLWFTGTHDEVVRRARSYILDQLRDQGSGAELGGKRHKRSGKKRSGKKRSGKKRSDKRSKSHKRSGHKRSGHKRSGHKSRRRLSINCV
jgi:hypothetical protein